jgi:hypothetical protein
MTTMLIAVCLFILAVAGLALGVILRNRPLRGSCGNCFECLLRKAES